MSSFQFSDEEKPQPASPPAAPATPATPPPSDEAEDDFSFLSQPPAAATEPVKPSAPSQPNKPAQPAQPNKSARPRAGQAQARVPGPPAQPATQSPPNNAPQAAGARAGTPVAGGAARPAGPKPLQVGTSAQANARPRTAPRVPDPLSPDAPQVRADAAKAARALSPVGVANPAAAPNPSAAAALTPTPGGETAEQVTGMETGEKLSEGFFGIGASIRQALNMLDTPATWALRVFGVAGLLCLAFLLAALFFGGIPALAANSPKAAEAARNLGFAAKGFSVCLLIACVSSLILAYDDNRLGAGIAVIGAALQFGSLLLLKAAVGTAPAGALVGQAVLPVLVTVGKTLFYIGAAKATIDLFDFLWKLPERVKTKSASIGQGRPTEAKQRAIASQANMLSPCWQLPFCREAIRVLCPAFIAKKTCWKFGRGCYCDEEMIARIVRGEPMEAIKAPTRVSQSKPPCGRCYIYLEHQTYKFRMLSPLALPLTIAIGFFGYPIYEMAFKIFDKGLQSVWGMFSFKPPIPEAIQTSQDNVDAVANMAVDASQVSGFAQIIIGVLLGFFLLIYISKSIEWAIFKAKL